MSSLSMRLMQRRQSGNYRELNPIKNLIDFSSNDYLGLARSLQLTEAVKMEQAKFKDTTLNGLGSTGSRLLTGHSEYIQELEDSIAHFHGYEAGTLFNCGYMANLGLISSLAKADDSIFFDLHVHASTHDGIRLCQGHASPFKHNDLEHLEQRLKRCQNKGQKWICIESIYSTDGSQAPLREICRLAARYGALIIVDEAHAVGIWGPQGRGLVAEHGLEKQVFAQIVTFGKALGVMGALVLGNLQLKQFLVNYSRPFIYTTALPFHLLAPIKCSYDIFPTLDSEREHLKYLICHFQQYALTLSTTQIQSLKIKGNLAVKEQAKKLARRGFDVRPLMSPTVKRGEEMLRICLHAYNTVTQISDLIKQV